MSYNQETYKRLGDYIREVDERNADLKISKLIGVNNAKEIIPSIANIVGTDLSSYKIVRKGDFIYNPITTRNGDKISISMYTDDEPAIASQAYVIFRVIKKDYLPEYLMLWFSRPEFDRYARYKSHGSAREIFNFYEMSAVLAPDISVLEQQRIVDQYNAIQTRIENNKQTIAKLEDTAQVIYRKMFVNDIDVSNLPTDWKLGTMGELCDFAYGKMPKEEDIVENGVPVYCGYTVTKHYRYPSHTSKTIIIIARGDAGSGEVKISPKEFFLSNLGIAVTPKMESMKWYLYYHLRSKDTYSLRTGSAQAQVTINNIVPFEIVVPPVDLCEKFYKLVESLLEHVDNLEHENNILNQFAFLHTSQI